jgi:hypothetical protein
MEGLSAAGKVIGVPATTAPRVPGTRQAQVKLALPGGQALPGSRLQDLQPGVIVR